MNAGAAVNAVKPPNAGPCAIVRWAQMPVHAQLADFAKPEDGHQRGAFVKSAHEGKQLKRTEDHMAKIASVDLIENFTFDFDDPEINRAVVERSIWVALNFWNME